jgi:hypothetical protein
MEENEKIKINLRGQIIIIKYTILKEGRICTLRQITHFMRVRKHTHTKSQIILVACCHLLGYSAI